MRIGRVTAADARLTRGSSLEWLAVLAAAPEFNLLGFGFLLHLPWELWLSAAGSGLDGHLATSGELPLALSLASLAHAALDVVAYWFVAATFRSRQWIRSPRIDSIGLFVISSFLFTMIAESVVMGIFTGLEHAAALPAAVEPGLGFPSVLQGVISPLLILAIVRRQLGVPTTVA